MAITEQELIFIALEDIEKLQHFVTTASYGIEISIGAIHDLDLLKQTESVLGTPGKYLSDDAYKKRIVLLEPIRDFAIREQLEDFPFLYGTVTVRLWSIIENTVDELVLSALTLRNIQSETIDELTGPLLPFLNSSRAEQAAYLAAELKTKLKADFKPGVARFECLLNCVKLGGPVDDEVRKALLELSEVRHVLVHRSGTADKKILKDRCPWLPFEIGEEIRVTEEAFNAYCEACVWYIFELFCRIIPHDDEKIVAFREKQASDLAKLKARKRYERT